MKIASHALTVTALLALTATPALARQVDVRVNDVRVKIDTRVIRQATEEARDAVREAMREAFGPEFRREITSAAKDIAKAFEGFGNFDWDSDTWQQSSRFRSTLSDRETRRFTLGANGQLDLETMLGDITVRPSTGREVVVEIVREVRAANDAAAKAGLARVKVESDERAGRVTVRAVYPDERQSTYHVSVDYIVSAPPGTRISTQSMSGDITVQGISGDLSVSTMSGDVTVTDAPRLTSARTASGDVTLTNVSAEGLLEANTMSGDVIATGIKARRVSFSTVSGSVIARSIATDEAKLFSTSGDVVFDGPLTARGRYEFTTHSGNVRLTLDEKTGFSFTAQSYSGGVQSALPLNITSSGTRSSVTRNGRTVNTNSSPKRMAGTFGDGSAVVSATSFSGNVIVIRK